jgi:hypothetical protein
MNKKFYFALALTAGLFASCSSDDIAQAPQQGLEIDDNTPAKIEIGIAQPRALITRGTGLVENDVADPTQMSWVGQEISVLMLQKGTTTLALDATGNEIFKGKTMTVNGTQANIPAADEVKYYPAQDAAGNQLVFDFWGYRLDKSETPTAGTPVFNGLNGAAALVPAAPVVEAASHAGETMVADETEAVADAAAKTAAGTYYYTDGTNYWSITVSEGDQQVTVPFAIDGTQDIMVAETNYSDPTGWGANHEDLLFSNKSARKSVKPTLAFSHLLTQLNFSVRATDVALTTSAPNPTDGSDATLAAQWPTMAGYTITDVVVRSKSTGELIVAYTGNAIDNDHRILWDAQDGAGTDIEWSNPASLTEFHLMAQQKEVDATDPNNLADIHMFQISGTGTTTVDYDAADDYVDMINGDGFNYTTPDAYANLIVYWNNDGSNVGTSAATGLPEADNSATYAVWHQTHTTAADKAWIVTYNKNQGGRAEPWYKPIYSAAAMAATNDLVSFHDNTFGDERKLTWDAVNGVGNDLQVGAPMLVATADDNGYDVAVKYTYWKKATGATVTQVVDEESAHLTLKLTDNAGNPVGFEPNTYYNVVILVYPNGEATVGNITGGGMNQGNGGNPIIAQDPND